MYALLTQAEITAFIILSIIIIILSRRVIFKFSSHGFYRLLGWECLAWIGINNYRYWFVNPFSINQLISWVFLIYAGIIVLSGIYLLFTKGKMDSLREDKTLYHFEKTTQLVETGIYKYIRHPLYGSLIFLAWGIFFKNMNFVLFMFSFHATIFFFFTIRKEEKENIAYFGDSYKSYIKRSKMIIPFIF